MDLEDSENNPVSIANVTVTSSSSWVHFGELNDQVTMLTYDSLLPFRILAQNNEANTMKFISWDDLLQLPSNKYQVMPKTPVFVADPREYAYCRQPDWDCEDKRGEPMLLNYNVKAYNGRSSLPIQVYLTKSPATEVSIRFTVDTECCKLDNQDNVNPTSLVTITPAVLTYAPWKNMNNFTVTVLDWDLLLGSTFMLHMTFDGVNKQSYYVGDQHDIIVTVADIADTTNNVRANFTLNTDQVKVWKFKFNGAVAVPNDQGQV